MWRFVFRSFEISWVLPERVIDLSFGWRSWMGKDLPDIWKLGPLCHTFEDTENTRDQLLASFVGTLLDWSHACGFTT